MEENRSVVVIGAGAAGYFAALTCKVQFPQYEVVIYEKTLRTLSKVKVSGGGRCNVTNSCQNHHELLKGYPRGAHFLKKAFKKFDNKSVIAWFEERNVRLKSEADGRVFPVSDRSQTIIDCLQNQAIMLNIKVRTGVGIRTIRNSDGFFRMTTSNEDEIKSDYVIIASGGATKKSQLEWLEDLDHAIQDPVPSLFTFNIPGNDVTNLMGVAVDAALAKVQGTQYTSNGSILITHWGLSGPGILKLSSFAARELAIRDYRFKINVNWTGNNSEDDIRTMFDEADFANKKIGNWKIEGIPGRLWNYLIIKSGGNPDLKWIELKKDVRNRIINNLVNEEFDVQGKTTFKEEFVTCGGIDLENISTAMESKVVGNLFFCGEILDIDGITGGYNFQAAWTTGYIAGKLGKL